MSKRIRRLHAFVVPALLAGTLHAADMSPTVLTAARDTLVAGKAAEAYKLLDGAESEFAGDVDADYLFGLAALEAGHPDRATLAFERVLALDPNHAAARLDMGRAYFALGDLDRAQREFDAVAALSPPPAAQATLRTYRQAIAERRQQHRTRLSGYIEAAYGRDSNVNQATNADTVFIPAFQGTFALSANGRERADNYWSAGGGIEASHRLDGNLSFFGGADLRTRNHREATTYDNTSGDLRLGVHWQTAADQVRLTAAHGGYRLDGENYRTTNGLATEWRRALTPEHQVGLFAQVAAVRYQHADLQGNDVDLALLGGNWAHLLDADSGSVIFATLFGGNEHAVNNRTDGDKSIAGWRTGGQRRLAGIEWSIALSAQRGRYDTANVLYQERRLDTQWDLALAANWKVGPDWSIRPAISATRNDSNLEIYDYRRHDIALTVRRDFR